MNLFYAPAEHIQGSRIELSGQEARHAAKVLRYSPGDAIMVTDGRGGWYEGTVAAVESSRLMAEINRSEHIACPGPELILAMGIIKKRDRLEFAVEKAVELGVRSIALFRSSHTIKENVRMDRLEATVLSAMKQSLRAWLPDIQLFNSIEAVTEAFPDCEVFIAHEKAENTAGFTKEMVQRDRLMLMIGPEGGFSEEEVSAVVQKGGRVVSLGAYRLRAETAAIAFLSQFIGA